MDHKVRCENIRIVGMSCPESHVGVCFLNDNISESELQGCNFSCCECPVLFKMLEMREARHFHRTYAGCTFLRHALSAVQYLRCLSHLHYLLVELTALLAPEITFHDFAQSV